MTDTAEPEAVPTDDPLVQKWVSQFVFLRDYVRQKDEEHKELLKQPKADMEALKGRLLSFLKTSGLQNGKTPAGSFYKTTRSSCTITDQQEFMRHVIGSEDWDLLDKKANATAVREWAEHNEGKLPPGVNLTTLVDVNVNRPRAK